MYGSSPFFSGNSFAPDDRLPFERFLPPVPEGMVSNWLWEHHPKGTWVLFPFSSAPACYIEAAKAGYRVLVAINNPIIRFLLEMLAAPPDVDDLRAVLAQLSIVRKDSQRLETHILELYATACLKCGENISADAFLWEKDANAPYAKIYQCYHCGDAGEFPVSPEDIDLANRFGPNATISKIHFARALERVAPLNDPNREYVEKALQAYPSRAIYGLFTLLNKLDSLEVSNHQRQLLIALLLSTFDNTNVLWHYPTARARPRQLVTPSRYKENNIWKALENGIKQWVWVDQTATILTQFPDLPPETGGICLFDGRLPSLAKQLIQSGFKDNEIKIQSIVAVFPRPNQAFWTLSALWTGWLWGYKSAGLFQSILRRQRYDWSWHTSALHATLQKLPEFVTSKTKIFGIIPEAEPGLLTAVASAADIAELALENTALKYKERIAQFIWRVNSPDNREAQNPAHQGEIIQQAIRTLLQQRGEPTRYLYLHTAVLEALTHSNRLSAIDEPPSNVYDITNQLIEKGFTFRKGLLRFKGSPSSLESGKWWWEGTEPIQLPLADRLEKTIVRYLAEHPACTFLEVDRAMCSVFPGLLTPETELVYSCLESYGETKEGEPKKWYLRAQDNFHTRTKDLEEIRFILLQVGRTLGYTVSLENPISWVNKTGYPEAIFYLQTSAILGKIVLTSKGKPNPIPLPNWTFIVIPGSRANLVAYKCQRDPNLSLAVDGKWRFLKFRLIRQVMESQQITKEVIEEKFSLDPLTYTSPQMQLL